MAAKTGVTYRLADDPDSAVFRSFGGFVLPTTVLLNRQGEVAYVWAGALTGDELRILIDRHIAPPFTRHSRFDHRFVEPVDRRARPS